MCKSNKTQQWRDGLSETEREKWMNWAKKNGMITINNL